MGNGLGSCVWVTAVSAPTSQWERGLRYMSSATPTRSSGAPKCERAWADTLFPILYPALPIPPSFPLRGCPNSRFRSSFTSPCVTLCPSLPSEYQTCYHPHSPMWTSEPSSWTLKPPSPTPTPLSLNPEGATWLRNHINPLYKIEDHFMQSLLN
jgi:hypothetical protein